jgi:hypothetical protein
MAEYLDYSSLTTDPLLLYAIAKYVEMPEYRADAYLDQYQTKATEMERVIDLYFSKETVDDEQAKSDGDGGRGSEPSTEEVEGHTDSSVAPSSPLTTLPSSDLASSVEDLGDFESGQVLDLLQLGPDHVE